MNRFFALIVPLLLAAILFVDSASAQERSRFNKKQWAQSQRFAGDGVLEVLHVDNFDFDEHYDVYYLLDKNKKRHQIAFEEHPAALKHGDRVQIRGRKRNDRELVYVSAADGDGDGYTVIAASTAPASTGMRSALLYRITSSDVYGEQEAQLQYPACTADAIAGVMWDNTRNVSGWYAESSYDKLSFMRDRNGDGNADIVDVYINRSTKDSCDYTGIASAADQAAQALGVDLSQYQHRGYVIPRNTSCSWAGLAYVGGGQFWVKGNYCAANYADIYVHEIGHNLALRHANQNGSEYNDLSCPMGYGGVGHRHFNAPHKIQMGWISSYDLIQPDSGTQIYEVEALEHYPLDDALYKSLLVPTGVGSERYFISYRRRAGDYSAGLRSEYDGRISIHKNGTGSVASNLVGVLAPGNSFSDATLGLSVKLLSTSDATLSALVETSISCNAATPSISLSPGSQGTGVAGSSLDYLVTVKNNDPGHCSTTTFLLATSVPSGWSASLDSPSLNISAGTTASTTISVASTVGTASGSYAFLVAAADDDGVEPHHSSVSATGTYVLDLNAPSTPSSLIATLVKAKGNKVNVVLDWKAATDVESGISHYLVVRNGSVIAKTSSLSYTDSSVPTGTSVYYVVAVDKAGNQSLPSNTAEVVNGSTKNTGGGKPSRRQVK